MKRFVSIFVVFVLIVTSVFATGVAYASTNYVEDSDTKYPVKGGNLYFDEETGTITGSDYNVTEAVIPDKINGIEVTGIGDHAFQDCASLTNINIPEGVMSIGEYAFTD